MGKCNVFPQGRSSTGDKPDVAERRMPGPGGRRPKQLFGSLLGAGAVTPGALRLSHVHTITAHSQPHSLLPDPQPTRVREARSRELSKCVSKARAAESGQRQTRRKRGNASVSPRPSLPCALGPSRGGPPTPPSSRVRVRDVRTEPHGIGSRPQGFPAGPNQDLNPGLQRGALAKPPPNNKCHRPCSGNRKGAWRRALALDGLAAQTGPGTPSGSLEAPVYAAGLHPLVPCFPQSRESD